MIFRLFKREQPRKKEQVGKIGTGDSSEGGREVEIGLNFDGDPTTPADPDMLPQSGQTVHDGDPVYTSKEDKPAFEDTAASDSAIVDQIIKEEALRLSRVDLRATKIKIEMDEAEEKLAKARAAFDVKLSSKLYRVVEALKSQLVRYKEGGHMPIEASSMDIPTIEAEIEKLNRAKAQTEGDNITRIEETVQFLENELSVREIKQAEENIESEMRALRATPIQEMSDAQTDRMLELSLQKGPLEEQLQTLALERKLLLNQKREIA